MDLDEATTAEREDRCAHDGCEQQADQALRDGVVAGLSVNTALCTSSVGAADLDDLFAVLLSGSGLTLDLVSVLGDQLVGSCLVLSGRLLTSLLLRNVDRVAVLVLDQLVDDATDDQGASENTCDDASDLTRGQLGAALTSVALGLVAGDVAEVDLLAVSNLGDRGVPLVAVLDVVLLVVVQVPGCLLYTSDAADE